MESPQRMQSRVSVTGFFLDMAAELEAEGGQNFSREVIFTAGSKELVKGGAEYGRGSRGFDSGEDGPAAFAGIGDAAGVTLECRLFEKRNRGEVEQPGGDHRAAAPDFGHI